MVITKTRKYGEEIDRELISRKRCVLIVGAHDAGKTRWLKRLQEAAAAIWGAKTQAAPLFLGALRPLGGWYDSPHLEKWWDEPAKAEEEAKEAGQNSSEPRRRWGKLRHWERAEALPDYLNQTGAVLFIDDAHKLQGRKLQIARECALAARLWVVSASEEGRIGPSLRNVLLRRDPQLIRLDSEVAYDATAIFLWLLIAVCIGMGAWEIAAALGGLKLLGSGRRAARQE
jgi:hypothetical protein